MAMEHYLPRLLAGIRKSQTVDHVVQAQLQLLQKILSRDSETMGGRLVMAAELPLQDAIDKAGFLFLPELQAPFRKLSAAGTTMLARRRGTPFNSALGGEAALSL
jgi:hypothetical protein